MIPYSLALTLTASPFAPQVHAFSQRGKKILDNFDEYLPKFKKIIPHDYKRMMAAIAAYEEKGLTNEQAQIEAFYEIVNNK